MKFSLKTEITFQEVFLIDIVRLGNVKNLKVVLFKKHCLSNGLVLVESNGETFPAATLSLNIRVFELKAFAQTTFNVIHFSSVNID